MDVAVETIGTADQGCDYTTFATWDASVDGTPEIFHIGVLYPAIFLVDDFEHHRRYTLKAAPYSYLLITFSGEIIAWKVKDDINFSDKASQVIFEQKRSIKPNYITVAKNFLEEHFGKTCSFDHLLFSDISYSEKIELIVPDFCQINEELVRILADHPEYLHKLHWRKFEELLTELFNDMGYEAILGPGSGDEGVDIRLISNDSIGQLLTLVQAKRYDPKYPLSLQPVQALYGAVTAEEAS